MRHRLVLVALVLVAACGGSKTPTAPDPTVTTIAVTFSGSTALVGGTYALSATAALSDGTTQQITTTGTWGVSPASLASISSDGTLTALAAGTAIVTISHRGQQGSVSVRIVPDYAGNWLGSYTVDSCSETGAFVGQCAGFAPPGRVLPFGLQFTQDGGTLTGRTSIGSILSEEFSTPIGSDGSVLVLTRAEFGGTTFDQSWDLNSRTAGRIVGDVFYRVLDPNFAGGLEVRGTLFNTNRQGQTARWGPTAAPRTLAERLGALTRQ